MQNYISPSEIRARIFAQHSQQPLMQNGPTYNLTGGRQTKRTVSRAKPPSKTLKGMGKRRKRHSKTKTKQKTKRKTKRKTRKPLKKKRRQKKKNSEYTLF